MARKKGEGSFSKNPDKNGYHSWTIDLGVDHSTGKMRRKVVKRKSVKVLKDDVRKYLRDREDGVPSTQGNAITGDAWAEMWLENVRLNRERRTHKSYADTWRLWLQPRLGKAVLEKIGTAHVQAAVNDARAKGLDTTARYILVVAKAMLNAARHHEPPYVKHDPCKGVIVPDAPAPRERILSHDEADEVLAELYRWEPYKTKEGGDFVYGHRHVVRFMLETGLRESEALGLQTFQLDLRATPPKCRVVAQLDLDKDGKPYVKPHTKGKNARTVALSPAAVEAIQEHSKLVAAYRARAKEAYDEWALVFPSEAGTPIGWRNLIRTVDLIRAAVNARREANGESPMQHWIPHDLRRTFGTRIAQTGVNMKVTQKLLGHADASTTARIYVVAEQDEMDGAVAAMKNRRKA